MAKVEQMHRNVENSLKGKLVVHLNSIKELFQLKGIIPELVDMPNSELA